MLADKFIPHHLKEETINKPNLASINMNNATTLTEKSILADKFIPHHVKAISLATMTMRWVCDNAKDNGNGNGIIHSGEPTTMDGVCMEQMISSLVQEFIPAVPCVCTKN